MIKKMLMVLLSLGFLMGILLIPGGAPGQEEADLVYQETWLQGASPRFANKKIIKVAVLQDGPSVLYEKLLKEIQSQTKRLLAEEKQITFVKKGFNAHWNPKAVMGLLGKALTDAEIDVILTVGILSTQAASNPALLLTKPVVATLLNRSELLTMPISSDGTSEKNNFTFVVLNLPIPRDFKAFHEMIPFERVEVLVDGLIYNNLRGIQGKKSELENEMGIKINIIQGGTTAESFLKQLNSETQAVMLTALPRMTHNQRQVLIEGINRMQIPSYSLVGYPDVEEGVLAGLIPETFERTARRAALDLQQVLLDFDLEDLSVMMPIQARLLINARTAKLIDYSPDFILLRTANFTDIDIFGEGEQLDLNRALRLAGSRNIDLSISQAETDTSRTQNLVRRSFLLPQGDSSITYQQVDRDRAVASMGILPQKQTTGDLNFSTVVFDDPLLSEYRSSKKSYRSAQLLEDATRLDVMLQGGSRFIDLLSAIALLRIEIENLNLTQENLEMAQMRFDVGMSGLDEVYRWEAQESQQRGLVFQRIADVDNAMVALNQALNADQTKEWRPVDIPRDKAQGYFFGEGLKDVLKNLKDFKLISEKLVEDAFRNSPTIRSIIQEKAGQKILTDSRGRRFYVPSLGALFDYRREFQSTRPGQTMPTSTDLNEWLFSGQVSLPLFQGGRRIHEWQQAKAILKRISAELTRAMQLLEQQTRSVLHDITASGPNIFFTQRAAEKAKLNLGIVKDKYAQGKVGIIDLIDAQNEYVTREQQAALAVYRYLLDLLELQRSVSWFAADHSQDENQVFVDAIVQFLKHGGQPPETQAGEFSGSVNRTVEETNP